MKVMFSFMLLSLYPWRRAFGASLIVSWVIFSASLEK